MSEDEGGQAGPRAGLASAPVEARELGERAAREQREDDVVGHG